jgi:predicted nucleic acid-binding protein
MPPILIDTNVLVYLYDFNQPDKQVQARQVLERLELSKSGRLSVQSLAEFLSAATRKLVPPLSPAKALEQVNLFVRMWPVFDLTPLIVLEAGRGARDYALPYNDAQIWAAARLNQTPVIFSEDFADGRVLEGVRFVNPFAPAFRMQEWL